LYATLHAREVHFGHQIDSNGCVPVEIPSGWAIAPADRSATMMCRNKPWQSKDLALEASFSPSGTSYYTYIHHLDQARRNGQ
jgi:hypothetical protein